MDNLIQLLNTQSIVILVFYEYNNVCRYMKCVDPARGLFFFLLVEDKNWTIPAEFNKIVLESTPRVPIVENSADVYTSIDLDNKIDDIYASIYLDVNGLKYKQIYEQIVRLGSCFHRVDARPIIEYENILCEMKSNFTLSWFKTNAGSAYSWYLCLPLSAFYMHSAQVYKHISLIEDKMKTILNGAFDKYVNTIQTSRLIHKVQDTHRLFNANKKKYQDLITTYTKGIGKLQLKEQALNKELQGSFDSLTKSAVKKQLETNRYIILEKIAQLQKTTDELKRLYLKNEKRCYLLVHTISLFTQ